MDNNNNGQIKNKEKLSFLNMKNPWGYPISGEDDNEDDNIINSETQEGGSEPYPEEEAEEAHVADPRSKRILNIVLLGVIALFAALGIIGSIMDGNRGKEPEGSHDSGSAASQTDQGAAFENNLEKEVSQSNAGHGMILENMGITLPEEYRGGLVSSAAAEWLVNEYRVKNGLPRLALHDESAQRASEIRAAEAAVKFDHMRPNGKRYFTVYDDIAVNCKYSAENLAYGQYAAHDVVGDWIASQKHNEVLLDEELTFMSISVVLDKDDIPVWALEGYSK